MTLKSCNRDSFAAATPFRQRQSTIRPFIWLFMALASLALLSAPGSSHDEMFHATNIWCGQGERDPYCSDIQSDTQGSRALVNVDLLICQKPVDQPLECPSSGAGSSVRTLNRQGLYPTIPTSEHITFFYFVLSWFVVQSVESSFIFARLAVAATVALSLWLLVHNLPNRYRIVAFVMMLTVLPATGFVLFSSINPSAWASLGVGFGWLAGHAVLNTHQLTTRRRVLLLFTCAVMTVMAVGSRWDAPAFIALILFLVLFEAGWLHFPNMRRLIIVLVVVGPLVLWRLLETLTPLSPVRFAKLITTYSESQPNNLEYFSTYLLNGLPNALEALGTVPTTSLIQLPGVVFISNVVLLGVILILAYQQESRFQIVGAAVATAFLTLVIMAQVSFVDARDNEGVEPRYSFPLLLFLVGWWLVHSSNSFRDRLAGKLSLIKWVSISSFTLTSYAVAERNTDVQSFSLQLLPEGPDHWWWSHLPLGPNAVLLFCIISFAAFCKSSLIMIAKSGESLA